MKKTVYYTTKCMAPVFAGILSFTNLSISVYAMTEAEKEEYKQNIISASEILQKAIDKDRQSAVTELKKDIADKGLDYQLTMMSYENQTDPYRGYDYNELIFAYAAAKENTDSMDTLYSLDFFTTSYEVKEIDSYMPKMVQTYKEGADGYYTMGERIYIDEPTTVITVEKIGTTGKYEKTGEKTVTPEQVKTTYGEVTVKGITGEDILAYFGLDKNEKVVSSYKKKLAQAESIISGIGLSQVYNIKIPSIVEMSQEITEYFNELFSDEEMDFNRKLLVSVAKALIGKVPYEWGGKSEKSGYDSTWWTLTEKGQQKGLDCSGFVQWAFRTAGFEEWTGLVSTQEILKNTETITENELKPGDLGLLNSGQELNHVGIYAGNGYWIHCSSGKGTVTVEKTSMFNIFKRMPGILEEIVEEDKQGEVLEEVPSYIITESTEANEENSQYSESDVYLLAQLIYNEAHAEGLNGWIAVAEIVRNRIMSSLFPSTVEEVIYQEGQFSNSQKIKERTPTEEEITVARNVLNGQLEILGNSNVLFFRNAHGSKEDWGSYKWFKEINNHEFYLASN